MIWSSSLAVTKWSGSGIRNDVALFERPYVVSNEPTFTAYHGGDRYAFKAVPPYVYDFLGEGEVNPMMVLVDANTSTDVTLLNSHGDVEEDFWVAARVYDTSGAARRPRAEMASGCSTPGCSW